MARAFHSADKPWTGVDLDGTLAMQYWPAHGVFHPLIIGKPIMPMVYKVQALIAEGVLVKVFTARVGTRGPADTNRGVKLRDIHDSIFAWTLQHIGVGLEATCVKDYNMIALYDDRAIHVNHNEGTFCCGRNN